MRQSSPWSETLFPALSLTLGLQIIRTIWPYLRDLLDDRLGWEPMWAGLVPFVVFATAFLAGGIGRWLGLRRLLLISAVGLGLARLAMQLWAGDPLGDLFLAVLGIICFSFFLPAYLEVVQNQPAESGAVVRFSSGILLGLALDVALHGAFLTYDFIWQTGFIPVLLTIGLVTAQIVMLMALLPKVSAKLSEGDFRVRPAWLVLGPFLALQALVFQNPARLAVLTGWSLPLAFSWVLISHMAGLWLATVWPWRSLTSVTIIGAVLVVLLLPTGETSVLIEPLIILSGQAALAILLTVLGTALASNNRAKLLDTGLVHGLGLELLVLFMFLSYILYLNLSLPFEHGLPLSLAALIIVWGVAWTVNISSPLSKNSNSWLAAKLALPLLGFPLFVWLTWHTATPTIVTTDAIRVMTYNVHNGFNTQGHLGLVALAEVIEAQQPDLIALQEVSRGSIVNGAADMLSWFSQRLNLPYVYTPAGDGLWGQATLSRYPIKLAKNYPLPPASTRRSFGFLQIDPGQTEPLYLINTHYQPRYGTHEQQLIHTKTLVDFLANHTSSRFIIAGDLNTEPDMPQMQPFFEHGFIDVIENARLIPGNTAHSTNPVIRIDYILTSPDLIATQVVIHPSTASDHLSIAATVQWK